jgi:hypothetical protein
MKFLLFQAFLPEDEIGSAYQRRFNNLVDRRNILPG